MLNGLFTSKGLRQRNVRVAANKINLNIISTKENKQAVYGDNNYFFEKRGSMKTSTKKREFI